MLNKNLLALVLLATTAAQAKNFQVGGCLQGVQNFPTIQTAVNGVPPTSTIFVCPGIYPEQVTILQPLTLRGLAFNDQDRPTIVVPPGDPASGGGLGTNFISFTGTNVASQVLVQHVSLSGNVNIIGVTVDGSGAAVNCTGNKFGTYLAGILYASGTSGAVQSSTVRNQLSTNGTACGTGIWLENGSAVGETINVSNNSVHDFDFAGIAAYSNQNPPTLTANISNNALHSSSPFDVGIVIDTAMGTISHNVITGGGEGIGDGDSFSFQAPGVTISNNDVANTTTGIALREGSTAKSNKVSGTTTAFYLFGGAQANPGPYLFANTIKNTVTAIEYNCTANVSLKSNTINDAQVAFDNIPPNFTINNAVNPLYNVDTLESGSCQ